MLWAVANTLTVFAIRNVGLSIAFPLWNTNSLVGLLWGWLLFKELRGAGARQWLKVLGGAAAIVVGACLLAYATTSHAGGAEAPKHAATLGILAALGAGALWGTMYIPYRKAYISGMNPLSFVTVFTFGELSTVLALALMFDGGFSQVSADLVRARPALFWLFLGGFCWVIGDLFQQYAAKYIGIGRGIPLSNTNQLWGLAWGALVFGELHGLDSDGQDPGGGGVAGDDRGRDRHQLRRSAGIGAVVGEGGGGSRVRRATASIPSAWRPRSAGTIPWRRSGPAAGLGNGSSWPPPWRFSCGSAGAPNGRPSPWIRCGWGC